MTIHEPVTVILLILAAFYAGYRAHTPPEPDADPPATHVPIACPICHDRIMVPTSSIASAGFVIRRDDLDIQAHMLTHPEAR